MPIGPGQTIGAVAVLEGGVPYEPGASTALGVTDTAGTFGVENLGSRIRIVWHYRATNEQRTFTLRYQMRGLAVAYDDVVDVYLKVWGDEWNTALDDLTATMALPPGAAPGTVLVFGHPASVNGSTSLGAGGISPSLTAADVPDHQWVEFRVVFPRHLLDQTTGAAVVSGRGLDGILAEEEAAAERAEREEHGRSASLWIVAVTAGLVPLSLIGSYLRFGREPRIRYDLEYEHAPPTEHAPALIAGLAGQGKVDEAAFTATLFDLIRRGVLTATPTSVERKTWAGLRREKISDLEIALQDDSDPMRDFERSAMAVLKRVLDDGPQPLTEFRKRIRSDAAENAKSYTSFRNRVSKALVRAKLLDEAGVKASWILLGASVVIGLGGWFVFGPLLHSIWESLDLDILRVGFGLAGALGLAFALAERPMRRMWVRRTREGALLNARWSAFRRYLEDFSRLEEAPPIALGLWEEYLVYAIALGVADDVLEAARLHAPPELGDTSHLYWYSNHGYGGHSSNAISGIERALTGAFAAPSSGSGGGGGFSGGGGGGGGGAW